MGPAAELVLAAAAAALVTAVLLPAARRLGWVDPPPGVPLERKRGRAPVPTVGGAAVALGALLALAAAGLPDARFPGSPVGLGAGAAACGLALAVGLVDDRLPRGLAPVPKVLGQVLAGLPVAWDVVERAEAPGATAPLALGLAALLGLLVAVNAVNVFDNADGALAGLAALAFLVPVPAFAGAALGFLPWNLARAGAGSGSGGAEARAYLGDAGSHLVGTAIALVPAAWPLLTLPLLDAARVALLRHAAGVPPWTGDRRHLAHLLADGGRSPGLADGGRSPGRVAGLLALGSAPAAVGAAVGGEGALVGAGATALAFAALVRLGRGA